MNGKQRSVSIGENGFGRETGVTGANIIIGGNKSKLFFGAELIFSLSFRAERRVHDTEVAYIHDTVVSWILPPPKNGGVRMTMTWLGLGRMPFNIKTTGHPERSEGPTTLKLP